MFILVNLKTYDCDVADIASAAKSVNQRVDARIAIAPQTADVAMVSELGVETWAQHISPITAGSNTGGTLAETVARNGGVGTLLNHSECRLQLNDIEESIEAAKRAGLETVVCANTPSQAAAAAILGPDAVAVEPPELIGTGTPVSRADPEIIRDSVAAVSNVSTIPVLCGAGISSGEDVKAAAELGADGVLLASGVAKAENPKQALQSLVEGI